MGRIRTSINSKTIELVRIADRLSSSEYLVLSLINTYPATKSSLGKVSRVARDFDADPPLYRLLEDNLVRKVDQGASAECCYEVTDEGKTVITAIEELPSLKAKLEANAFAAVHELIPKKSYDELDSMFEKTKWDILDEIRRKG
ncbi:MAG: hypothetical protein KGH59_01090 [Candidatus Micrarchaeota archaeon]|nr:hypothetical protein [Candidatus Micrarchaeota archaeon]MDE1804363.1 hypothetical protein [Candidatus Micrarchaeota archaeon]MDE1846607.1 hypothetical protein [Candidatus Micrarchaeota archaeon]